MHYVFWCRADNALYKNCLQKKPNVWKNKMFSLLCTDLGSLIGIFDYGYFTVWKFSNFSDTLISHEINFADFRRSKTAVLIILKALNFDF